MSAGADYRLIVTRGSRMPALLAGPNRIDHVEIVEVQSGEVVLFWDCEPREAARLARLLRTGLDQLDAEEFIARWSQ